MLSIKFVWLLLSLYLVHFFLNIDKIAELLTEIFLKSLLEALVYSEILKHFKNPLKLHEELYIHFAMQLPWMYFTLIISN